MARPRGAVRARHAPPPDDAHGRAARRDRGRAHRARRAAPAQDEPADHPAGGAVPVLERRVEGRGRVPRGGHRDLGPRPARRTDLRSAGDDLLGRTDHRRGAPDHGDRLRAGLRGPPRAAAAPADAGDADRLGHGRRLDRLGRARHGRLRPAAARARRRPRRPRRPPGPRADVRALGGAVRRRRRGRDVRLRLVAGGGRRRHLDRALRRDGRVHGLPRRLARRRARARDLPERRGRQARPRARGVRAGPREPRRRPVGRALGAARRDRDPGGGGVRRPLRGRRRTRARARGRRRRAAARGRRRVGPAGARSARRTR